MIYDISNPTLIDPKPLRIIFDKIDGFIRIYDETRYLILFGTEKYKAIYERTRYLKLVYKVASHIHLLTVLQKLKLILMILCLYQKYLLCIMLYYTLNQF